MSGPARKDLAIYRGDSFALAVEIIDEEDTPYDLTGVDVLAQVRTSAGSASMRGDLVATLTPVVDDPETGKLALHLTAATTAALRVNSAAWDLQLSKDGGVWTPLYGSMLVSGDVSVTPEVTP